MAHTFTSLLCHVIFSTKDRQQFLDADSRPRIFSYMGGILRAEGATALIVNGPEDHVHALIAMPPTQALSDVMRVLKTNSSRWVHEQWPQKSEFAWQAGYGAFSVSKSNAEEVRRYIDNQEEHHKEVSFQDEFRAFLRRHGITFDERYIWE
jgi:putative transposase